MEHLSVLEQWGIKNNVTKWVPNKNELKLTPYNFGNGGWYAAKLFIYQKYCKHSIFIKNFFLVKAVWCQLLPNFVLKSWGWHKQAVGVTERGHQFFRRCIHAKKVCPPKLWSWEKKNPICHIFYKKFFRKFLGKNLSSFVSPVWKLHNRYCHILNNT